MSIPVVYLSSFNFFRLKFATFLAPPLCVLCVPPRLSCLIASSRYLVKGQCVMGKEMFTFCCLSRNKNRQKLTKLILYFAKWQHRCAARHSIPLGVWPAKFNSVSNTGILPSKLKIFRFLSSKLVHLTKKKLDSIKINLINVGTFVPKYRVIHKSLRDFWTRLRNNKDRHGRKEHINK